MSHFAIGAHRPGDPAPIYDLYGVVNHHGGILGGHYTSYARCADLTNPMKNEVGESESSVVAIVYTWNVEP